MSKRKKKRRYDAGAQARRLARAVIGTLPCERVIPSKKKKPLKHKKRELAEQFER